MQGHWAHIVAMVLLAHAAMAQQATMADAFLDTDSATWARIRSGDYTVHPAISPIGLRTVTDTVGISALTKGRFMRGHLLSVSKGAFSFAVDPSIDALFRYGTGSGVAPVLGAGLRVRADITNRMLAEVEYQFLTQWPMQMDAMGSTVGGVVPGRGPVDINNPGGSASVHDVRARVAYRPSEFFTVDAGYDKLQFGTGHRSLFLSPNADQFLFLRLNTSFWRIRYVNVFANFRDIRPGAHPNKFGTFHYLSMNVGKRFNFGFFESIIWQGADSTGSRGFEPNYLNPIIFYRPVEFSLNSPDNAFVGLDVRLRFAGNNHIYGQLLLDEFILGEVFAKLKSDTTVPVEYWGNKQGWQIGLMGHEPFKLKGLFYRTEFNWVRPFTYTHVTVEQNYGHTNQALAHPLGANFMESFTNIGWRKGRWAIDLRYTWATYGTDSTGVSHGQDIYKSYLLRVREYGNYMTQGLKTQLNHVALTAGYLINPEMNLRAIAGVAYRDERSSHFQRSDFYFTIGISSSLFRYYSDY